ncbi:hypothetical protein EU528_05720 [Candidatus Thorarchaeota archaeon]|nr:MAG: hypothetical protein EU528_05720 [Candidatus Thorarchaeota archaeon]
MQVDDILTNLLGLFSNPVIMIATLWIIGVVIAVGLRKKPKGSKDVSKQKKQKKSKGKVKGHLIKQMQKMEGEASKDKKLSVPPVRSRQEIITDIFESKTSAIGLKASTASGYVPVSYTPLARYLKERNVSEDTVSAIIDGIMEEESEEDVKAIIEAAADSPGVNLVGAELEKAKELAVEEWNNVRDTSES